MPDLFWSTWEIVPMIEQSAEVSSMRECIINIANVFGFTSVFGGIVRQNAIGSSRV